MTSLGLLHKTFAMLENSEIIIGDIFPQPATGSKVFVSVYASEKVQGKATVTDQNNQEQLSETFDLEKEGDALELDIGHLASGDYRVLINILREQWERKMWVKRE